MCGRALSRGGRRAARGEPPPASPRRPAATRWRAAAAPTRARSARRRCAGRCPPRRPVRLGRCPRRAWCQGAATHPPSCYAVPGAILRSSRVAGFAARGAGDRAPPCSPSQATRVVEESRGGRGMLLLDTATRRGARPARRAVCLAALGMLLLPRGAAAHERWFVQGGAQPVRIGDILSGTTALALVTMGAVVLLAWLSARLVATRRGLLPFNRLGIASLAHLYAWLPPVLAIHAAVPLIVNGVSLRLFAPNLALPWTLAGGVLALAEIVVALSFLYGAFTRAAAIVLALIGLVGMLFFSPWLVLEHCDLLGIAAFLYIAGRGPYSVDALIGRAGRPNLRLLPYAVPALRVLTGFAIVVLGFTEKLWNRDLALAFLRSYPFNVTQSLPIALSDAQFVVAAGLVEVSIGALIMSGLWTRPVILLTWLPFNLTLPFLGWVELVGHLPTYGTMVVLLLWGAGQDLTPYIRAVERAEARLDE